MADADNKLTRIGVFYDGNFFFHVSNYYAYQHERRARLGIHGLHAFIRAEVAKCEGVDARYCQIVDSHYFRGRLSAHEAENRALLLKERLFDDVLINEGVVTHYLPLAGGGEKGIDVWLALEVFELAVYKRFNVGVLITGDRDFVPLVRKLNTLGTRVMLMGWEFSYVDSSGAERSTGTAQQLFDEATYPLLMSGLIDDKTKKNDLLVNNLFLPQKELKIPPALVAATAGSEDGVERKRGAILNLLEGFGFIKPDTGSSNVFFFHADVLNRDFNDLQPGQQVDYLLGENEKGPCARSIQVLDEAKASESAE